MASKRRQRRRSCENKVAHDSFIAASYAASKLRKSHQGGTWAAYRCQWCGRWHVGRPTARQRQSMRDRRQAAAE